MRAGLSGILVGLGLLAMTAGGAIPAAAQYAVDPGEAIAAKPLSVMSAPVAGASRVMEVEAGRTVTVLGYPRGTGMAWIAIAGRELGYVNPADLAPVERQRPILFRTAVVADGLAGADGVLPGDQLLTAGDLVAVTAVRNGKATVDGAKRGEFPPGDLTPVIGTYRAGSLLAGASGFYAARLGRFASLEEARRDWAEIQGLLPELARMTPYLFRRVIPQGMGVELAAGPFDRVRVEEICVMLARRGRDCWVVAVDIR